MFSSKPRLVVPYGLKTLLEGVSRAILKTKPPNITQFAAVYFKELIVFREGNTSLDIKDLVKQFHQVTVEKWSEGMIQGKKPECVKELGGTSAVSQAPTRMEKSTDTEEDNIAGLLFSNKTTQFPSVNAEFLESESTPEAVCGPSSKPTTPKTASPPSSPPPADVSPEYAYVPADPAQFAAQMLGKVSSTHSDQSDVLMVDVATSMPAIKEALSSEPDEDVMVASSEYSREVVAMRVVDSGPKPKGDKAEPSTASSFPLQDEQEPPAYNQAPEVSFQAESKVTSAVCISSVYNNQPVIGGVVYVEQMPEQILIPFSDQVACLKENEQSPPVSSKPVVQKTTSGTSKKSVESVKLVHVEEKAIYDSSVHVEAEATVLLSDTYVKDLPEVAAQSLDAEGSIKIGSEKSLHLEVEIISMVDEKTGQEEAGENSAPWEKEVKPGEEADFPEGLSAPEEEAAPDKV
ncbi:calcium-binding tyrosine phosphorylation-regulated protein isoform X1 [Microcebus murinus]|uniref:Calcium-binding tyrosine phosphorylation-regulated protein n=1 Tax=Microcebus murinus TaxID=30608 RepID=A0A8B7F0V8_MICMU|nr:calcium-binding tyrosine phosphorylation-regulated protein isoform X1 [Microcebus murinus]XP_012601436.1 calcium-binding tyrosine phosphorylation-regulated protein isoform X1 [Microcebus murinus]XP_012601437.1 calcium-binding tyrosine phosphorylation-regulated protein isoform X1 [Microcebus murinus]